MTTEILGVVATVLVIAGYVPQIVHLVNERCTAGISVPAFSLWVLASFLFLVHAAAIGDAIFVAVQTVNVVAGGLIVGFCRKYKGQVCLPSSRGRDTLIGHGDPENRESCRPGLHPLLRSEQSVAI